MKERNDLDLAQKLYSDLNEAFGKQTPADVKKTIADKVARRKKPMTPDEENEMDLLVGEAEGKFLAKNDFNAMNWMDDESLALYVEYYWRLNGDCPSCGETDPAKCECGL